MANTHSYRFGQTEIVGIPVDSGTVISIGDMVYLASGKALPAASTTWNTNLATTQADFANVFLGISQSQSANGDTDDIDVDISPMSVYEFSVASDTYTMGVPLGADKDTGNAILSQTLEDAVAASSVATCYKPAAVATTLLKVKFASAFNPASSNANISLG